MTEPLSWDVLWTQIGGWLAQAAASVFAAHPEMRSRIFRYDTEIFPLRAGVVFVPAADPAADEVAAVSLDAFIRGDRLELTTDVASDAGHVLGDGPGANIPLVEARRDLEGALASWMTELRPFLVDEAPKLIIAALNQPRS